MPLRSRPVELGKACLAVLSLLGCTKPEPTTPRAALGAYSEALRQGRADAAYAMLSDEAKRDLPFAAFERMLHDNPAEAKELASQLSTVEAPARVTASVAAANGDLLLLVLEDGEWRVDASVVELYSQKNARQTIESFVRALERRRYDVLIRFVPSAKLGDMTPSDLKRAWEGHQREEIQALAEALRASLPTARIEVLGDRATFAFGAGGAVELVREEGVWKVEDVIR